MSLLQSLDQPLPVELVGREHGWFTRYRRYPVFSRPWARGRARSSLLATGLFGLTLLLVGRAEKRPVTGLISLLVTMLIPLLFGPWAGSSRSSAPTSA